MADGATRPELAAAVRNAGGLGSFPAAILPPAAIAQGVQRIRARTQRSFNVNLFVLEPAAHSKQVLARTAAPSPGAEESSIGLFALLLGAQAAQTGTAVPCCPESGIYAGWKRRRRERCRRGNSWVFWRPN